MVETFKIIIDWLKNANFLEVCIFLIVHFSIQNREKIHGDFQERISEFFSIQTIFTTIRYCAFILIFYLFYNLINNGSQDTYSYDSIVANHLLIFYPQNILVLSCCYLVLYFVSWRSKILNSIVFGYSLTKFGIHFKHQNRIRIFWHSILFFFISIIFSFLIFYLLDYLIHSIDRILYSHKFYINENAIPTNVRNLDLKYKNGVYFSLFISSFLFLWFINIVTKWTSNKHDLIDNIIHLLMVFISCLGIFEGIYSISNFIINYLSSDQSFEWLKTYASFGYLSIKITSILLSYSILKFVYQFLFKGNFIKLLLDTFKFVNPKKADVSIEDRYNNSNNLGDFRGVHANFYDNYYFIQVGFYILNIFVADYLISITDLNLYSTILFVLLPIFVDDYLAIHFYFKKFGIINKWQFFKKNTFNILLFTSSVVSLINGNHFLVLLIYILLFSLLLFIYALNIIVNGKIITN